jgi:hypothetical protein
MRKLVMALMLMIVCVAHAQKTVYNVQNYCIDEYPLRAGSCDQAGTEYSFVFVDIAKGDVTLFLADNKLKYQVLKQVESANNRMATYLIEDKSGKGQMSINSQGKKIIFEFPQRRITLKTGASTRAD